MKRVFIIHCWGDAPNDNWYPWLKRQLEEKGFEVNVPEMPDTATPKIETWVSGLASFVGELNQETYFVGHSVGCQAILRYLATQSGVAGGVVLVTPWLRLKGIDDPEEYEVIKEWVDTPLLLDEAKNHSQRFSVILSDSDPFVFVEDGEIFKDKLGAEIIIEQSKGHITKKDDGITELPSALEELLKMANEN